ncbi:hypothetical protein DXT63_11830 [Thermoanaerobacteraceae bacterium SP2]|nr:hypothetical protein DXT63_11830 [Thermoanaerobacteraceae bacterium SP2]
MLVSMEKVREKLEERRMGIKARLWDSLTDEQMTGIYRYAMEEQEELLSKADKRKKEIKAKLWDSLNDEQVQKVYKSLSRKQEWLLNTLECIDTFEPLLRHGEWPDLCENDEFIEE